MAGLAGPAAPAHADAQEVGGGATGVTVQVFVGNPIFGEIEDYRTGAMLTLSSPSVILPPGGSAKKTKSALNFNQGGVKASALKVTTVGNLQGNPYAESSASVARLTIPGVDVSAARSDCRWDEANGISASSSVVTAGGEEYAPAPNTVEEIPGGYVIFNEQGKDELFIGLDASGAPQFREVIWVNAVHAVIDTDENLDPADSHVILDVVAGFSSCDPVKLPSLTGLGLTGNSS